MAIDEEYGGGPGKPPITCTDVSNAFYDANRRVSNMQSLFAFEAGSTALGTMVGIIGQMWATAAQGNSPADALTAAALERRLMIASVAIDVEGTQLIAATWDRNILAGLMRTKGCL
jgi:hypothetical protein